MADENTEEKDLGNPAGEPSTPETEGEQKPEPQVPLARLREEVEKRRELEKQIQDQKQEPVSLTENEQKIRETLSKIEKEKIEQTKQEELKVRKELEDTHAVYGEFDEDKLLKIVERYGCYDGQSNVMWDAAMELYGKITEVPKEAPQKPKLPQSKREGSIPQPEVVDKPEDVSKFSMHDLVERGKRKFGLE